MVPPPPRGAPPRAAPGARPGGGPIGLCAGLLVAGLAAAIGAPARAADDPAYPAATCAALWTAHARTLGPGTDPEGFRQAAIRLSGDPVAVDAFIATQTLRLVELILAYVDLSDAQSRDLFQSLLATCERFAAEAPETR